MDLCSPPAGGRCVHVVARGCGRSTRGGLFILHLTSLRAAVAHRMAALAHRQAGFDLDLGPAPQRIAPLRELLAAVAGNWNKGQQDAALTLARGMGWRALLRTRISLGKGDYQLQVDGRGAHLLLDGDVKAVATDIDRDALLERLGKTSIPPKLDAEVRATLGRRRR